MPTSTNRRRVLLVANDHVGARMAGPAIRYVNFARELAGEFDVTLVVANEPDVELEGVRVVHVPRLSHARLKQLAAAHDAVIAQQLNLRTMRHLAGTSTNVVYDLYDPFLVENLVLHAGEPPARHHELEYELTNLIQLLALASADAVVCASERQRDLWLGVLSALGRVDPREYERDPTLRRLIAVVPFGLEAEPPRATGRALKGVVAGIGEDDRVLLWGGGIWNWLDPLTVIRAVHRLSEQRDDVKLYFLGIGDPNPARPASEMTRRALALAKELDVYERQVFFNFGWVPYAERQNFLLEADLGVSAHFDNVETRFAFRTRLLDYLWAGLPTITTRGDALGDLVRARGLGRALEVEDADAWAAAIAELLDDEGAGARARDAVAAVRDEFAWPRVVAVLADLVREPGAPVPTGRGVRATLLLLRYQWLRLRISLLRRGPRGSLARLAGLAAARRRGGGP
jgi:glycosyltransferase involved in cell wall biosynthesis